MRFKTSSLWLSTLLCAGLVLAACSNDPAADGTGGRGTGGAAQPPGTGGAAQPPGTGGAAQAPATGGSSGGSSGAPATGGRSVAANTGGASVSSSTGGSQSTTGGTVGPSADAGVGGSAPPSNVNQDGLPNVTLHLAGDSTVMTYNQPTATADEGWGQELGQYFISKVMINNQAIGGASVATFHTGRWGNIMNSLKAGDYVMAAFGANDSGSVAGRHVEPAAFQALFGQMADEVKAKQATFIPVTPSALQEWAGGKNGNNRLGPYVTATIAIGPVKNVLVDDLNARSLEYLNMIGQTAAMQVYKAGDKAHFTKMGATQMAKFVAEELRRIGSPLAAYLK